VYHRFTKLADRKKRIYDQDLLSLVAIETAVPAQAGGIPEREQWAQIAIVRLCL
jgi:hypothetical protein